VLQHLLAKTLVEHIILQAAAVAEQIPQVLAELVVMAAELREVVLQEVLTPEPQTQVVEQVALVTDLLQHNNTAVLVLLLFATQFNRKHFI
jgi:hypothetical protein